MYTLVLEVGSLLSLQCNGKEISWKHLEDLYHKDNGANREAPGLSMVPKLKYEHIHLSSFSKMRVDLAAQVSILNIKVNMQVQCTWHTVSFVIRSSARVWPRHSNSLEGKRLKKQ